ncbi:MAG: hypothetical protein ABI653_05235 [Bacteroidota bacterium]
MRFNENMTFKKAFYYFYYKIYKFAISISDDAINEWKLSVTILFLEILLIGEMFIWYSVATKKIFVVNNPVYTFFPIVAILAIINYFVFTYKERWKNYIQEFENYDKKKNLRGSIIVFFVIAIIIFNLIFAFYQMSQIDWKMYRGM